MSREKLLLVKCYVSCTIIVKCFNSQRNNKILKYIMFYALSVTLKLLPWKHNCKSAHGTAKYDGTQGAELSYKNSLVTVTSKYISYI